MNTEFVLLAQYNKAFIPLADVCKDYFNIGEKKRKNLLQVVSFQFL